MSRIRWTPQAVEDLQAIRDFIARDSEHYALLVVQRLVEAIDVLEDFPAVGRRVPEHAREDLRELVRPPYRVVYRLSGEVAHILTVFHASRRIPEIPLRRIGRTSSRRSGGAGARAREPELAGEVGPVLGLAGDDAPLVVPGPVQGLHHRRQLGRPLPGGPLSQ